jgi:hypothetical protein
MQWKIEKRYAAGLYLLNSFTWSKALDNAAGHLEAFNNDNSRVNYRNLPGEKGLGSYNQPVNNTTTVVWEIPYGKGRRWGSSANPVLRGVIGGWRVTGINTATAGQPVNISYAPPTAFSVSSYPTYRPNYVGGSPLLPRAQCDELLQQSCLRRAQHGNPERSVEPLRQSRPQRGIDARDPQPRLRPSQGFPVDPRRHAPRVPLRVLQPVQQDEPGAPSANVLAGNFGTITSLASPARQIQFALKLVF